MRHPCGICKRLKMQTSFTDKRGKRKWIEVCQMCDMRDRFPRYARKSAA